jgi:ubiquinone/menaquinone biosynthesis C-methylase UbiE
VDPNPGVNRLALQRIRSSGRTVEHLTLRGEALPMPEATYDTVVSTWTLCSIAGVEQALREVRRVLKPGGRLLFLEHGLSPAPRVQRWQRRLTPIQRLVGDGCHLDRDIRDLVQRSGLQIAELDEFYAAKIPRPFGYMYKGIAVKA